MKYIHVYVIYNPEKPEEIIVYNGSYSPIKGLSLYNGFIDPDIYSVVLDHMKNIEAGVTPPNGEIELKGQYSKCHITYHSALTTFEFQKLKTEYKNPSMHIRVLNKVNEEPEQEIFSEGFGGIRKLIVFPSLTIFKENRIGKPVKTKEYLYRLSSEKDLVKELRR